MNRDANFDYDRSNNLVARIVSCGSLDGACHQNTAFPTPYPAGMGRLGYGKQLASTLPILPVALDKQVCRKTHFASLPELPVRHTILDFCNNPLDGSATSPVGELDLKSDQNLLSKLPPLPVPIVF